LSNKNVFSCLLNTVNEGAKLTLGGRLLHACAAVTWNERMNELACSVRIVAQRANRYIVAFHIAISYDISSLTRRRQSSNADGRCTSTYWSDWQSCAVCRCVHLQI